MMVHRRCGGVVEFVLFQHHRFVGRFVLYTIYVGEKAATEKDGIFEVVHTIQRHDCLSQRQTGWTG
jgi:hypothetical protein